MKNRTIDKLGFGGLRLPLRDGAVDTKELSAMIDCYLQQGGTYFDTAHGYVNGLCETAFRECLVKRYPRDAYLLADKLTSHFFWKEEEILPLFEEQLACCGVTYFDYYFMHAQSKGTYEKFKRCRAYETVWELKRTGKIHRIGISIHDKAAVLEQILTEYPWIDVVQIQHNYIDYHDPMVQSKRLLEVCEKYHKPVFVMEALKGGSLVRLPKEADEVFNRLRGGKNEIWNRNAGLAYRYAADSPQVERVLSGVNSLKQVQENVTLFKQLKPLDQKELEAIEEVRRILQSKDMISCTACRYCIMECPKKIAIPDLFACMNQKNIFHDWNQDYYYHTVHTTVGRKASDCLKCGKCEEACPQHLPIRKLLVQVADTFEKKKIVGGGSRLSEKATMIPAIGSIMQRLLMAYRYGGDFFEYFKKIGVEQFDFIGEEEMLLFSLEMFRLSQKMPERVFCWGEITEKNVKLLQGKYQIPIEKLENAESACQGKTILYFCRWDYTLLHQLRLLGYRCISFGEIVDYTLYKSVVLDGCLGYLKEQQIKSLLVKFPQATRVRNQDRLEKWLSDNSIYGYSEQSIRFGLDKEDIVFSITPRRIVEQGILKILDEKDSFFHVINGMRITLNHLEDAPHTIWCFGSSVLLGTFADDAHTIPSALQNRLNCEYGEKNRWNVVNAANYWGNNVYDLLPWFKSLPIQRGDICVFLCEFPMVLLEQFPEIVNMSPYFDRPHNYGEIFVDINHMTGKGYCVQGNILFELLNKRGFFKEEITTTRGGYITKSQELNREEQGELREYLHALAPYRRRVGAIVMNCNPFTWGHRYLIEYSAERVEHLFVFVVEEDASFFPFSDRIELVKKGTSDLNNVTVLPSGKFMISKRTFEAYSNKKKLQEEAVDASLDVRLFATQIAPALGITVRFAGEEPLDQVTRQYNETMKRILPQYDVEFQVIPRKEYRGKPISASYVRKLLEENNFDEIKNLVPDTTYQFLVERHMTDLC